MGTYAWLQEHFCNGFMVVSCHLSSFSWRSGSFGIATCAGGGAKWLFLGLLHSRLLGSLLTSPPPASLG